MPSTVDGTSLSYYGYSFEVPWRGIDQEQNEGRWVEIDFKSGQIVRFVNPKYFQEDPVIARDDPVITNDGATKYEKYKAVLSMTPSQLSPFCSHQNFARALRLLEIKGM